MSVAIVEEIARELPPSIRNDIVGYVKSVERTLPEIFREAGIRRTKDIEDKVIFMAGVKKLYAICSSNYWIIDNSLHALRQHAQEIRFGSLNISRDSSYFHNLQRMQADLMEILRENDLFDLVEIRSYSEMVRGIVRER